MGREKYERKLRKIRDLIILYLVYKLFYCPYNKHS